MSKWAGLVYARTLSLDFRMIVVPQDFQQEDIDWARSYASNSMIQPEELRDGTQRWSMFQNERHRVVGVTFMARQLWDEMVEDEKKRPLHLFLGYVARQPTLELPPTEIEQFKSLYEYVRSRWFEKYTHEAQTIHYNDYDHQIEALEFQAHDAVRFNFDEHLRFVDPLAHNNQLWQAVSACRRPVSLCLGFKRKDVVTKTSFLNSTCEEAAEPITIRLPRMAASDTPPPQPASTDEGYAQPTFPDNPPPSQDNADDISSSLNDVANDIVNGVKQAITSPREFVKGFINDIDFSLRSSKQEKKSSKKEPSNAPARSRPPKGHREPEKTVRPETPYGFRSAKDKTDKE